MSYPVFPILNFPQDVSSKCVTAVVVTQAVLLDGESHSSLMVKQLYVVFDRP